VNTYRTQPISHRTTAEVPANEEHSPNLHVASSSPRLVEGSLPHI
jgi:hypothetical protein